MTPAQITALRTFLIHWQFWWLELLFLCSTVATIIALRRSSPRRVTVFAAIALGSLAIVLTNRLPPRTSRIFYDEQIYQNIGQSLADEHLAQMCNEGRVEYGRLRCLRGEYNKEPYGYPFLLSLIFRVAGSSDHAAFRLNNVAAGLAVAVTFGLAMVLFERLGVALLSALVLMLLPMQLTWSNTAAAEPTAALLAAAAVLAATHFARVRTTAALWCTVTLTAWATTFRPENILVIAVVGVAILLLAPSALAERRFWLISAAGAVLALLTIVHMAAVRNEPWGTSSARFSLSYVATNFPVNFWFYFGDRRFPALVGLAAVAGLIVRGQVRVRLLLAAYFAAFWLVFLCFYAGSYDYGADVRYSLMSYVPISILAGRGLDALASTIQARFVGSKGSLGLVATASLLVYQFFWYAPLVRERGEEAWAARADVKYAKMFAARLPPNSLVMTHNPSMFLLWGVDAGQMSIASNEPAYVRNLFARYAGGVYLHWNFWCNVSDPVQVEFCHKALAMFPNELVDAHLERDYRFALYRLK